MAAEKTETTIIEELQNQLNRQEAELVSLREERNKTIRQLRKAKLAITIPSDAVLKLARDAGPLDDEFFNKIGEDLEAIEEIIATVLNVPIKVISTVPQYSITNIGSRGVRLDNYAEIIVEAELLEECLWGKKGAVVDIEVQKQDKGDHDYRVFYNGASMIINKTPANTDFIDIPRAIVIFISAYDPYGDGEVYYENVKADKNTGKIRKCPLSEIYINAENMEKGAADEDARTRKIAAMMKVFKEPDWYDDQFPAFSRRKRELHETEKGVEDVGKEMQLIIDEEIEKNTDNLQIENIRSIKNKLKLTTQQAMDALSIPADKQTKYAQMV